jgi:hypothetical protein
MRFALERYADLPEPSPAPAGREPDPARFSRYVGTYRDTSGGAITVSSESGQISVSGPLLDALGIPYEPVLEPTSLDNFELWVSLQGSRFPVEITFIQDESGNYGWFRSRLAVARRDTPAASAESR